MTEIHSETIEKWQHIVDTMAKLLKIPAGLIMRKKDPHIEVFVSSHTENNPYTPGDKECLLNSGLYCETVINTKKKLLIPDATKDKDWKDNPDIKLGMISYLGFPIIEPDGDVFGTICVLDNKENHYSAIYEQLIVQFKELIETHLALEAKNKKLEDVNTEKDKLFSVISHDLMTPFNSMIGLLQLFCEEDESFNEAEQLNALKNMLETSQGTYSMLENLLTWARYQRGSIELNAGLLNVSDLLSESLSPYKESARKKNITFEQNIDADLKVCADKTTLRIVLNNLINNAIKFTPRNGTITITGNTENNLSTINIKDTGVGIKEENIERLFKENDFLTTRGTEREKGTGLGLSICHELITKNSGTISVESTIGTGSTFTISLPAE